MKVVVRDAAYEDLDQIYAWIADDRPRTAQSVIARIFDSTEVLGHFPYMGHPGKAPGTYEWIVRDLPYIVVYTVNQEDNEVVIVAVFHGAQDRDGIDE